MGVSSLLGLLDGLGDLLGKVFGGLFTFLINTLVVPVVQAAIRVIVTVLQYFGSTLFYEISKFLLALIDFVEVLFRALAGLPSTAAAGHEISMSINGKSGDLLIQMLTSSEVMQAFYATAIVGMFLLIITTIFQMIKVEYTTEGAQNSKSGIIGKSLKSLCNMMIIPILCILGVFIGNQVLDLIDTATGGGEGSKISGTLWVAAASTALVNEDSFIKAADEKTILEFQDSNGGGLMGLGINLAIRRGFASIFKQELKPLGEAFSGSNSERAAIESAYMKGTKSFYNISEVVKNYNPFEVNYLVLIFGACIIIKCLYYTCFGLIDRLYQCVALFIVMPMVVGMSPVKDSLGSWRSKFMSKALSAYGTVISLNLFFIIVKILLNIKIDFGSFYSEGGELFNNSSGWPFPPTFMEGLIKSIMVIVGCLMIEKLAGDLGGYFGGGNAMSDGKGLSNDATAGIKKAAAVGMGVATGGARMIKAGAGIAGKVGKVAFSGIDMASKGKLSSGLEKLGNTKVVQGAKNVVTTPARLGKALVNSKVARGTRNFIKNSASGNDPFLAMQHQKAYDEAAANEQSSALNLGAAQETLDTAQSELSSRRTTLSDKQSNLDALKKELEGTKSKSKRAELNQKINAAQAERDSAASAVTAAENNVSSAQSNFDTAKSAHDSDASALEKAAKPVEEESARRSVHASKMATRKEGLRQLYENKFGAQALFNNVAPKSLQNLQKDYQSAVKDGNATPEGQAMLAEIDSANKKASEEAYNSRNKGTIGSRNTEQAQLILTAVNAKLVHTNEETNKDLQKLNTTLNDLIDKMNKAKDQNTKDIYANQISAVQQNMQAKNSAIKFGDNLKVENETALTVDFRMDQKFIEEIKKKVREGVKMDDIMAEINKKFKEIGLTDKDTLAKIYKALEELKGQVGGK